MTAHEPIRRFSFLLSVTTYHLASYSHQPVYYYFLPSGPFFGGAVSVSISISQTMSRYYYPTK